MPNITYHDGQRQLQDQFETQRLATALAETDDIINPDCRAFTERMDLFFMATVDDKSQPNCSYKGGDTGIVRVVDEHTIAFPSYDGNGMYLSMGNVLKTRDVGLLYIDFENQRRIRFNGTATFADVTQS